MLRRIALLLLCLLPTLSAADIPLKMEGGNAELQENVRNHIGTLQDEELRSPAALRAKLRQTSQAGARALGYFLMELDIQLPETPGKPVRLTLTPNSRVTLLEAGLNISGAGRDDPQFQRLARRWPFSPGDALHQGKYEEFKESLSTLAHRLGYFDARFLRREIRITPDRTQARLHLDFDTGQRYQFGPVTLADTRLSHTIMDELTPFTTGTLYTEDDISELNQNLLDTGYFSQVTVTPDVEARSEGMVPVNIFTEDAPRHRFSVGPGYGTDSGPRLKGSWERPLINAEGHSARLNMVLTGIDSTVDGAYRIPSDNPLTRYYEWQGGYKRENFQDTESERTSAGLQYFRRYESGWEWRRFATLEYTEFTQGVDTTSAVYLIPGMGWSRREANNAVDPRRGYKVWSELAATDEALGSPTSFAYANAGIKMLLPMGQRHQWIARAEVGAIAASDFSQVPPSRRFFAGGDQSVRGYDYQSLAPETDTGKLEGGRFLNVASLEYQWRWKPDWRLAVFVDSGRAYTDKDVGFHTGAGVGIRWRSPIGLISVDLASAVSDNPESLRLHIFMGPPL